MAEIIRRFADRFFPSVEQRHPNAVLMRPSFFDPHVADLLERASEFSAKGDQDAARLTYLEATARQTAIFEGISPTTQKGLRDRAEYGVMVVSGLVSAHENEQAREFEARLNADILIPADAKRRAAKLIEFLDQDPEL